MSGSKTWYVSCEACVTRRHVRSSVSFESESEAKQFAKEALASRKAVYAGTINPHVPKRFIPAEKVDDWINEVDPASVRDHAAATSSVP
jgi:hypothetical protein